MLLAAVRYRGLIRRGWGSAAGCRIGAWISVGGGAMGGGDQVVVTLEDTGDANRNAGAEDIGGGGGGGCSMVGGARWGGCSIAGGAR